MSKKDQAQQIFNSMKDSSRKEIIEAFVAQLSMTPAGAATYYANCKRASTGGAFNVPSSKQIDKDDGKGGISDKGLYTIVTPRDEEGKKVVDCTHSYTSLSAAKKSASGDEIVVRGMPELDSPMDKLKPIA